MNLPQSIALYLSSIAVAVEPVTKDGYAERLNKFSAWIKGRTVTKPAALEYHRHLLISGMARSSVAIHLSTLRTFYRWLVEHGHVPSNPIPMVRSGQSGNIRHKEGFTAAEYATLLTGARGYWPYAVRVAWATGFRLGDVALLRAASIHIPERTIEIVPKKTKRSNPTMVEIPISDDLATFMEPLTLDPTGYVCPEMAGQYLADGHKTLSAQFCAICRKAGIAKGFHCFRHAFISRLISQGVSPALVAEMCGITLNRVMTYVHTSMDVKREAISKIIELKSHAA